VIPKSLKPVPISAGVGLMVGETPEGEMCEISMIVFALGLNRAEFIARIKAEPGIWYEADDEKGHFYVLRSDLEYVGAILDHRQIQTEHGRELIHKLKEYAQGVIRRDRAVLNSQDPILLLTRAIQDMRAEQLRSRTETAREIGGVAERVASIEAGITRTDWRTQLELMLRDGGISDRNKVNAIVRHVARRDEKSQQELWDRIYYRLRYERSFDAYARAKPRRNGRRCGEALEEVQRAGLMPVLLQIARRVLLDGRNS
jgi:hypothetical protein